MIKKFCSKDDNQICRLIRWYSIGFRLIIHVASSYLKDTPMFPIFVYCQALDYCQNSNGSHYFIITTYIKNLACSHCVQINDKQNSEKIIKTMLFATFLLFAHSLFKNSNSNSKHKKQTQLNKLNKSFIKRVVLVCSVDLDQFYAVSPFQ